MRRPVYLRELPVSSTTTIKLLSRLAVAAVLIALLGPGISAHEVPNEVSVFGFVRPDGKTLHLMIRAPLKSMRDVDIPTLPNGYLDFTRMEPAERHAAQVWIRDFVHLYENGTELPLAEIVATRTSLPSD